MSPDIAEVIDTGDGIKVDMGFFNVPPVREQYIARCDMGMVKMLMERQGLTFDEAITKSLYHACRMVVRQDDPSDGLFGWIHDTAKDYHGD